ncbi:MAG: 30S ribosomal protein S15 [Deltaproteobacteria bacterium]|jgi:small subunit ribosomal protein S15|nr:30S ribosomal protein S15 [Deltaproteobacteria bacterium]MBQ31249.1 30S ribosomal protein S15 [Deltaproteobacteria bacterium]MDP7157282.1 30S ribosomal protein S15 [SAR324 cluster bacterium]MDP7463491.1 30S ribosomal protein S15 [SAR324 cluster bacterium]MDP7630036.1 30S ribosomal protein S15 [SAR324 cluster bacterium]|tara:strand:+ start:526 stop:804 length:279 start_codon:yes stop_codon:yes gene_type:complete
MLTKEQKDEISKEFGKNEGDTGSTEVQIALLSARITYLTEHLQQQPKDFSSRRGLLKLVGQRRNFLNYLKSRNLSSYDTIIQRLAIRRQVSG